MGWVIDLDGVIWLADAPIEGSAAAVARLRQQGQEVVFVTNNSSEPVAAQEAKLAGHGIDAAGSVVTSALIAASMIMPGERALPIAGPGVIEALAQRGVVIVEPNAPEIDVVVVGFHRNFDYERMKAAAVAVHRGARLLATNNDPTYPTPEGPIPGGGAILASIVTATGVEPAVAGKPNLSAVSYVRDRIGDHGVVVGDRPDTDGEFAVALGYDFALVLSGVTTRADLPVDPHPVLVAQDLAEVVERLAGSGAGR